MNNKFLGTFIFTAVLLTGLIAGLFLVKQNQEIRRQAEAPSDILVSLSPGSQTVAKGEKAVINIVLTNRSNPGRDVSLYAAEANLAFDSSSFSGATPVCNSGFLPSAASSGISGGTISIACFAPGGSGARTIPAGTQNVLGTVELTALDKLGTSEITITHANVPDSTTYADLSGGTGVGGSYTISAVGGGTSAPTPTSTPGETAGSGATATAKPTVKPTAKPTPKSTRTASPTVRVTATPEVLLPVESPTPLVFETFPPAAQQSGSNVLRYVIAGVVLILILGILIWLVRKIFGKGNPPKITPPPPATPPINMVPPMAPPTAAPPQNSSPL